MPVIQVRALPQPPSVDIPATLRQLTAVTAERLGLPPRRVRALWDTIEPGRYAMGDEIGTGQGPATHAPIVSVMAFEGRTPEQIAGVLQGIAEVLARACAVEAAHLFISWQDLLSGCLMTGGEIRMRAEAKG